MGHLRIRKNRKRRQPTIVRAKFELVAPQRGAHGVHEVPLPLSAGRLSLKERKTSGVITRANSRVRSRTQSFQLRQINRRAPSERIDSNAFGHLVRAIVE